MKKQDLLTELARLETKLDIFETELCNINEGLKKCGFSEGIATLKTTITEILEKPDKQPVKRITKKKKIL